MDVGTKEVLTLSDQENVLEEEQPASAIIPEETQRPARSLLLTTPNEQSERAVDEIQLAASKAIPSLVTVQILWKDSVGLWQQEQVNAVCMDGDGLYATSWVKISRGEVFRIQHQDGSLSECVLDSFDPATGVALLKSSDPEMSKPAIFANGLSEPFGSPLLFIWLDELNSPQAIRGYLSGVTYDTLPGFTQVVSGYLQPDLRVSSQQEGGLLIDLQGRLIGLLLGASDESSFTPMLSAEDLIHACRQLKQLGYVSRSDFGLHTQRLTPAIRTGFGWPEDLTGILVTRVREQTPAAQAGIEAGDLIVELNGRKVSAPGFFQSVISRWPENKILTLGIQRGEVTQQIELIGVSVPEVDPSILEAEAVESTAKAGSEPAAASPALKADLTETMLFGEKMKRLVVEQVDPSRLIFSPDVVRGDVIVNIIEEKPESSEETETPSLTTEILLERIGNSEQLVLQCYRNGEVFWSSVRSTSRQ